MNENEIRIKVNGGTLIAFAHNDPYFPSIAILFETENGDLIDVALAEVKAENSNKDIDVYTYEDVTTEDFTRKFTIKHNEIIEALYKNGYQASIKEAQTGLYLTDEGDGKFKLGTEKERIIFYDETEAESVLNRLNDTTDLMFVLLKE